jgi:hypothetical protein
VVFVTEEKNYFSTYPPPTLIHLSCPIVLSVRRNPQHRSLLAVVSATSALGWASLRFSNVFERISRQSCEPLYAKNTSHRKQEIFLYEYPLHWVILSTKRMHKRTLLSGSTLLKQGHHIDYWNQPLNVRMCVWYLDSHEDGLCCYLVILIEKPITSITAVSLQILPNLLALLRIISKIKIF